MTEEIRIGQIGVGYWGPNLVRNLSKLPNVDVVAVADSDPKRLTQFSSRQVIATTTNYKDILKNPDVHAVVIATPAASHGTLTMEALEAGKHVLIEKPLATSVAEGEKLVELADRKKLVLMVGHTFLYNSAVRQIKKYLDQGDLGSPFYLYSQRLNLGRVRQDVNALWNFAPHDVSIIMYLLGATPATVSARGFGYLNKSIEDVVFATLTFPNGVCAHLHVSWLDPQKVRKVTVVGSKKMLVYDDVSDDKILLYDRQVEKIPTSSSPQDFRDFAEFQMQIRSGDVVIPHFPFREPLQVECEHFVESIRTGKKPLTDGRHGLDVVRVLEATDRSIKAQGALQKI